MVGNKRRNALTLELILPPLRSQVLAVVNTLLAVVRIVDVVAKTEDQKWRKRPDYPLVGRPAPASQRRVERLASKQKEMQEAQRKEPKEYPERTRYEHEKAARVKLASRPEMHVQAPERWKLLHHSFATHTDSFCLFPRPLE